MTDRRPELLRDLDRPSGWVLMVGGVEQSYVDTDNPTHLEFEYMQHFAIVVDAVFPSADPLRAVHLGGGAATFARWLAGTRPDSAQVVVEHSADVLSAVAPLGPVPGARVVVAPAGDALATLPAGSADLVVWDLYDGPRVVTTALTLADITAMHRLLDRGGLLLLNVSDAAPFDVVRPVVATLRVCLDEVALLTQPTILHGRRSGNVVLAASMSPLPVPRLVRRGAGAPVRARVLAGDALTEFVGDAMPATTDAPLPEPDERLGRGFL